MPGSGACGGALKDLRGRREREKQEEEEAERKEEKRKGREGGRERQTDRQTDRRTDRQRRARVCVYACLDIRKQERER